MQAACLAHGLPGQAQGRQTFRFRIALGRNKSRLKHKAVFLHCREPAAPDFAPPRRARRPSQRLEEQGAHADGLPPCPPDTAAFAPRLKKVRVSPGVETSNTYALGMLSSTSRASARWREISSHWSMEGEVEEAGAAEAGSEEIASSCVPLPSGRALRIGASGGTSTKSRTIMQPGLEDFHAPDHQSQGADHGFGQTDDGFFEGVFGHSFLGGWLRERPGRPQGQKKGGLIQATPL